MIKRIYRYLKSPKKLILAFGTRGWFRWIPNRTYLQLVFWAETGEKLNLDNPATFNEKLQWLKIFDRDSGFSQYVDKYEVRSYIKETIGEEYLKPVLNLYEHVDEINWDILPEKFVLKCTHGSHASIICTDKGKIDVQESKKKLKKLMKKNWYWHGREWPYKNIRPRIICEQFISDTDNVPDDYKVLCFGGVAKLIALHTKVDGSFKEDFYDANWNKTNISKIGMSSNYIYKKPELLEKMIKLSEYLAANINHVRVDWFIVGNNLYFGEITFYNDSGLVPFNDRKDDYLLGSWIDLSNKRIM